MIEVVSAPYEGVAHRVLVVVTRLVRFRVGVRVIRLEMGLRLGLGLGLGLELGLRLEMGLGLGLGLGLGSGLARRLVDVEAAARGIRGHRLQCFLGR